MSISEIPDLMRQTLAYDFLIQNTMNYKQAPEEGIYSGNKGLASYCKAKTTFTFHSCLLTLSNALLSINNKEMKSESGFSLVMVSQPL